jgi:hypothetical protein
MSFFVTERFHAVMPAYVADKGGLPWRDDTGVLSYLGTTPVSVVLSKIVSSQVWARGALPLSG